MMSKSITVIVTAALFLTMIFAIPFDSAASPTHYEIYTLDDLDNVRNDLTGHYTLMNDIDASDTATWAYGFGSTGFRPIGDYLNIGDHSTTFRGSFDGGGFEISNLHIDNEGGQTGLFGYIRESTITNLGVTNADITGHHATAGVIAGGGAHSTISECFTTGDLTHNGLRAGGIIGSGSNVVVENSYSSVNVTADQYAAGVLYGITSTATNSYFVGTLTLNGGSYSYGVSSGGNTNTYYNSELATPTEPSGTPKTTSELKQETTFADWDFETVWYVDEGESYPILLMGEDPPEDPPEDPEDPTDPEDPITPPPGDGAGDGGLMETLATALYLLIFCFIQAIFVLVIAAIVKLGEVLVSVADGRNDRALDIIHELPITEGE